MYVFQKAYLTKEPRKWIRTVAKWRERGARVQLAFDLCDPDFLEEEHKRRLLDVLPLFDFAVGATEPLRDWLAQWLPAYCIPDRVDVLGLRELGLEFDSKRITGTRDPRLVWAGYEGNVGALEPLLPTISELGLWVDVLTVERPKPFAEFWAEVLEYDVLLNPRPETGRWQYKSDNKTLIAWALGMPVARTGEDLWLFCDPVARGREVGARWSEVLERWDVKQSVEEWQQIVARRFSPADGC